MAAQLLTGGARANELCRFVGTTDYAGRVAVTASADTTGGDGMMTVDVILRFSGAPMPLVHVNYLMEEITTWESGRLRTLATNTRYLVDGHIVRQQWDVFDRGGDGLNAYRLQGKQRDDFRRKHPSFARHWDPATFGQPWIQDYWSAHPERRRDLDLPASSVRADLRTPLALAFYWSRRIPLTGAGVAVFLPGFKKDKRIDLMISAAAPSSDGERRLQTAIRYPALGTPRPSIAKAWVSMDGHLLQLAFNVQSRGRTASGVIRQEGCR